MDIMKRTQLMTKEEIRNNVTYLLDEPRDIKMTGNHKPESCYLGLTGKKRELTKWIKSAKEHLQKITEAFQRPNFKNRFYLGDFITHTTVKNEELELEIMKEMRKELDNLQENDTYSSDCPNEGM